MLTLPPSQSSSTHDIVNGDQIIPWNKHKYIWYEIVVVACRQGLSTWTLACSLSHHVCYLRVRVFLYCGICTSESKNNTCDHASELERKKKVDCDCNVYLVETRVLLV